MIVYRLGCRSKISIRTFFQIWIRSIQIDFIAIFRFERFYTTYVHVKFKWSPLAENIHITIKLFWKLIKLILYSYIFLGFALSSVLFRARICAVETGMDLELDFNSKSTWYSTVSITYIYTVATKAILKSKWGIIIDTWLATWHWRHWWRHHYHFTKCMSRCSRPLNGPSLAFDSILLFLEFMFLQWKINPL